MDDKSINKRSVIELQTLPTDMHEGHGITGFRSLASTLVNAADSTGVAMTSSVVATLLEAGIGFTCAKGGTCGTSWIGCSNNQSTNLLKSVDPDVSEPKKCAALRTPFLAAA